MKKTLTSLCLVLSLTACGEEPPAPTPPAASPPVAVAPEPVVEEEVAEPEEQPEAPVADAEDHCAAAHGEVTEMIRQLQEQLGPGNGGDMPSRADFLAGCRELPAPVQPCMRISYAMEHGEECQQARDDLDPETLARVQRLMGR